MKPTKKQFNNIICFIVFILGLIYILNFVTPYLYRWLPNDYIRTHLIIETLADTAQTPDVVIFGNSRGMSGINGYMLEEKMKGNPTVYSLTSTGQQVSESALYYTSLPSSVKVVLQCVDIDQLSKPIDMNTPNRIALHMYGYEMDALTEKIVPSLSEKLDISPFYYNYEARNCLFTGLSIVLRNLLDDDVIQDATAKELRYPTSKTSDRNDITYQRDVDEQNLNNKFVDYEIIPEWKQLLEDSYLYFQKRDIMYCLIIMPYNPDIKSSTFQEKQKALELVKETFQNIPMIDCFSLLEASDFYDAIHPNSKGAKKITERVILQLP